MRYILPAAILLLALAPPLSAQSPLESTCQQTEVELVGAEEACLATVQAAVSAQPVLGLLLNGGNPTLGSAGETGLSLGVLPRTSVGLRLNFVRVRLPDIITDELGGGIGEITRRFGAPLPAIQADASVALFDGFSLAPGIGGIGGLSALGSVSMLPYKLFGADGFRESSDFAFGYGVRLHLLDESFIAPGVSASIMRRDQDRVSFGDVCSGGTTEVPVPGATPPRTFTGCTSAGDLGEFSFDLESWSTRVVASKHLLGFGLSFGLGHDSYDSEIAYGFRGNEAVPGTEAVPVFRVTDQSLESQRWIVFGGASFSLLVATGGVEVGWQQGDPPIAGFGDLGSHFDPKDGTWFGTVGFRVSL